MAAVMVELGWSETWRMRNNAEQDWRAGAAGKENSKGRRLEV